MKRVALLAIILTAASIQASTRLTFIRKLTPAHQLPGEAIAVIYAIGDTNAIDPFIDTFIDRSNRSGILRIDAATDRRKHFMGRVPNSETLRRIRHRYPADAYLGINRFSCELTQRGGEGSVHNVDGVRVKQHQVWIDAVCTGRVEAIDPVTAQRLFSFEVKGEGTSPRVGELTEEERGIAVAQAAHFAAVLAAEAITPRQIRESIDLDDKAANFGRAMYLIDRNRMTDARRLWESSLAKGETAPLHFDLAALCEAMGDVAAAREHFEAAVRLTPANPHYRAELLMFKRRNSTR